MIKTYDKGSPVLVEVEFKKNTPFVTTPAYYDPTPAPTISIIDPSGVYKVTDAVLTKSAVGKYYYVCQTTTLWLAGTYSGKTTGSDGTYSDITNNIDLFKLK